jgi:Protein of unknown function (DUF3106)
MMLRTVLPNFLAAALRRSTGQVLALSLMCAGLGLTVPFPALAADSAPLWSQLTASEQKALLPLEGLWSTIGPDRKQKWREVASRFPTMSVGEQQRIRERMVDWAKMSPTERGTARLGFEQSKTLPASERQAGWEAYRSLPEEQRKALATQATVTKPKISPSAGIQSSPGLKQSVNPAPALLPPAKAIGATQSKSNIVVASPVQGRPVAPAVVQATVGASTRPINQKPSPPQHHQPGQPKIAATPEFVNKATLLPQRPSTPANAQALQASTAAPAALVPSMASPTGSTPVSASTSANH